MLLSLLSPFLVIVVGSRSRDQIRKRAAIAFGKGSVCAIARPIFVLHHIFVLIASSDLHCHSVMSAASLPCVGWSIGPSIRIGASQELGRSYFCKQAGFGY